MDVNELLSMSETELLGEIGKELTAKLAFPLEPEENVKRAQGWFKARVSEIRKTLCHPTIRKILQTQSTESQIVIEVAKIIAGIVIDVTPIKVAALVVKLGIEELCKTNQD